MLILFIYANASENNDSIDQKPEKASIFISEETSIYGKEIIYNTNYIIIKKKQLKTNAKLSVNKNKPRKTQHTIPIIKQNYFKNTILYNHTELFASVDQKAQCIRLIEQHELGLTVIYYTGLPLHSFRMVLLSIYNHIPIEHHKNMIASIRPPPKNNLADVKNQRRKA
jgi:hypothetical protein